MSAPPPPVVLALGSNIDAERALPAAVRELAAYGRVVAVSSVWQTEPAAGASGADFLNAAVLLEPNDDVDSAHAVLRTVIPAVESTLGRVRVPGDRRAPRRIDVDLTLWGDFTGTAADHDLPDPHLTEYAFLAVPVAELLPDFPHPATGERLATIADRLRSGSRMTVRGDVTLDTPD